MLRYRFKFMLNDTDLWESTCMGIQYLVLDARLVSLSKYLRIPLRIIIVHNIIHRIKHIPGIGVQEVVAKGAAGCAAGHPGKSGYWAGAYRFLKGRFLPHIAFSGQIR